MVLEAAAAQDPLIATRVGGVPEIFGPYRDRLIAPNDADLLRDSMVEWLATPAERLQSEAAALAAYVHSRFCMKQMVEGVLGAYRDALAAKAAWRASAPPPRLRTRASDL